MDDGLTTQLTVAASGSALTTASARLLGEEVASAVGQQSQAEESDELQQPAAAVAGGAISQALASNPVRRLSVRARTADAISQGLRSIEVMDTPEERHLLSFHSRILHPSVNRKVKFIRTERREIAIAGHLTGTGSDAHGKQKAYWNATVQDKNGHLGLVVSAPSERAGNNRLPGESFQVFQTSSPMILWSRRERNCGLDATVRES